MHEIEPFYNWRHFYVSEEDEQSPNYGKEHSEFEFSNTVYNYLIHPQWDDIESNTLYLKVLFVDYDEQFAIIEFIGEWNDAIENDVMLLKRNLIDLMIELGIVKFILIVENVMNFHSSDDSYYEEWNDELKDEGGWIAFLNLSDHLMTEFKSARLDRYCFFLDYPEWRTHQPEHLYQWVENKLLRLIE